MSYFTARAPHHLPVGERGLCAIETVEAKGIAAQWMSPAQVGISAFATAFLLYPKVLVEAVCDVRALLAQGGAYELRLLLVHLQGLCQTRGIAHRDGESDPAFWCWCQPYEEARHPHVAAAWGTTPGRVGPGPPARGRPPQARDSPGNDTASVKTSEPARRSNRLGAPARTPRPGRPHQEERAMKNARISIRKSGTRAGQPTYTATCASCGCVLNVTGFDRQACIALGEKHKSDGCRVTLRWAMCDASGRFRPR